MAKYDAKLEIKKNYFSITKNIFSDLFLNFLCHLIHLFKSEELPIQANHQYKHADRNKLLILVQLFFSFYTLFSKVSNYFFSYQQVEITLIKPI